MLHDYSLEQIIRDKMEERIEDPLTYQEYTFDISEWSNIPSLVP